MTAKRKAPTTAFQPGTSGNPKGKPAGTRSKATQLLLALMEGDASAITKAVIDAAKGGDLMAAKTIATLTRRLLVLRERIDDMADCLCNHSDRKHADLSYEMTFANATADIAAEFCAELMDTPANTAPLQPLQAAPDNAQPSLL